MCVCVCGGGGGGGMYSSTVQWKYIIEGAEAYARAY